MSHDRSGWRGKKRRRAVLASVGLLAALVGGGLAAGLAGKVRDASDRSY